MYLPQHFTETDQAQVEALIDAYPLACVVAQTDGGMVANHLPLLRDGAGRLIGHIARANPLHRLVAEGAEVLAIFQGAEGYISPNWYPSKAEHHRHVPTWNYEVAHIYGRVRFFEDDKSLRAVVGRLTKHFEQEAHGAEGWRMSQAPADYMQQMLGQIVGLEIEPTRILAKAKIGQNRETKDRLGAADGLEARGNPALAQAMRAGGGAR